MAAGGVQIGEARVGEAGNGEARIGEAQTDEALRAGVQAGGAQDGHRSSLQRTHSISVIVPTKDRPFWLAEALASVQRVADRLHGRATFERLVVDDGDAPATFRIALDAGARYLRSHGRGVSAARNSGLRAATGDLIAFLDDDDVWTGPQMAAQLDVLAADSTLGAVFGQLILSDADLHPRSEPWPDGPLPAGDARAFFAEHVVQLGTFLVRRSAAQRAGGFDERLTSSEDWDWILRLARVTRVAGVAVPVILMRHHRDPRTQDLDEWWRRQRSDKIVVRRIWSHHLRDQLSPFERLRWRLGAIRPLGYDTGTTLGRALACLESGQDERAAAWVAAAWHTSPLHAARLSVGQPRLWRVTAQAALAGLQPAEQPPVGDALPQKAPTPAV